MGCTADMGVIEGQEFWVVVGDQGLRASPQLRASHCPYQPVTGRNSSSGHLEPYQAFPNPPPRRTWVAETSEE